MSRQVVEKICCTESSRTVCTTQAKSISGGSFQHFQHLQFFVSRFYLHFLPGVKREFILSNDFVEDLSHHFFRCLTISCVSSSQALMSSARIPSLSGDLPFFEFPDRILQVFTRDLWCSRHFFSVADVHVYVAFISIFVLLIVVVKFFVDFTTDIGDPFT